MSDFYSWLMRGASAILFVVAIIVLIGPTVAAIIHMMSISNGPGAMGGGYLDSDFMVRELWLDHIFSSIAAAVWPFFGAAVLWRWDRRDKAGAAE